MTRHIGIYEGMSWAEYEAVDALSGSRLLHIRRSPLNYRYQVDNPQESTEAQKLGTVIHTAILEPPLLGRIAVWGLKEEEKVRRGKVWDAFQEANAGKILLTKAEQAEVENTVRGVYECAPARKYLTADGPTEVSMFWIDQATGVYMKGRLDKVITTKNTATVIDLKKTRSCSARKFGSQAFSLGYHIKAAIYASGYQTLTGTRPKFKWIAMESKAPYECAVYRATPDVMTLGGEEWTDLVARLKACEKTGNWPPEQEEESDLILPTYAYENDDDFSDIETELEPAVEGDF